MVQRSTTASQYKTYDTFEERAGATYGHKIDPLYWDKYDRRQGKRRIAIICLLWCVFGAIAQFAAVFWSTKRSVAYMDQMTAEYNRELLDLKMNAMKTGSIENKEIGDYERRLALYKQQQEHFLSTRQFQSSDKPS